MTLKALIFDLDGTLLDTAPDMVSALNTLLERHDKEPANYEVAKNVVSQGSLGLLKVGFGISAEDDAFENLKQEFLDIYATNICEDTKPFEGMLKVLDYCETKGVKWGIVTNKPTYLTEPILKKLGLFERAQVVVCGDTLNVAKPHPGPLLHSTTLLKVAPSHCVYLGDDIRDMTASNAAGMHGAVALWGYFNSKENNPEGWGAEFLIKRPSSLIDLINDLID